MTGIVVTTIGEETTITFTTSGADAGLDEITGGLGLTKKHPNAIISSTTNWRQE